MWNDLDIVSPARLRSFWSDPSLQDDDHRVVCLGHVGKMAIAEGKLEKQQRTRKQLLAEAEHKAAESGRKVDSQAIKTGKTVYLLAGSGAVILGQ
jgi:hypothetical protein